MPRTTIHSQNDLSFILSAPPWQGGGYFENMTQEVTAYDHSHAALGGFWTANVTLHLPLNQIEDWVQNGLGRQLRVRGRASTIVWEGIVNRVTFAIGGYDISIGPFMDIANKVKVSYSIFIQLSEGSSTGIRVTTDYIEDVISQSKYGVLTKNFSAGGIDSDNVADLQEMLLERYKNPPRTENLTLPGDTGLQSFDVKLECVGYAHMFQRYLYTSAEYTVQNLSGKLAAIVAAEPNGLFLTPQISTNDRQVVDYEQSDSQAWGLIKSLVAMGDTSLNRYTFGCYENRGILYAQVTDAITYIRPLREGMSVIQNDKGGLLQPWEIRPGAYIMVTDLIPGKPIADNLGDDTRVLFAETVQYRFPDNLIINGAHIFRVEQRLAQLGISGIS